jgi:hypothetical protein
VDGNQQTHARLHSKVLGQRHRQQRRAHSKQQVKVSKSLLSSVRPSPTLASMARTASSCWQERDASSTRHASLSTHRCCDGKRTRARTAPSTPNAEQGVAACYRVRRATDLDVHGSSVLDARKQRLQLLSARADVCVERADFETAAPQRHLALALEKVEQLGAALEQNMQRLERRRRRRNQDRRAACRGNA